METSSADGGGTPGLEGTRPRPSGNATLTPPPEPSSALFTRRSIVLSFWAIVLCLGLPHWLWTTSTYRATLPLSTMNDWAEGKACDLRFPFPIHLRVPGWTLGEEEELAGKLRVLLHGGKGGDGLGGMFDFPVHVVDSNDAYPLQADMDEALKVVLHVNEAPNAHEHTSSLEPWEPTVHLSYGLSRAGGRDGLPPWVAAQIRELFKPQQEALAYLLNGTPFAATKHEGMRAMMSRESEAKLDARSTRAFKPSTTYHLSFSLFVSGNEPSAWAIEDALGVYVKPLIDALSGIANFTVTTQVQLRASFSPSIAGPTYDEASGEWKLRKEGLSGFVNAAEWPLSPSVGEGSTINFVLYVPAQGQSPLVIAETGGTGWLVPQWGSVAILNPNPRSSQPQSPTATALTTLTAADLEPVMLTFAEQLTSLIGLPSSPTGSLALRLAALQRERTASLLLSSSSTLGALSRLVHKLPNIPIPDTVATSVSTSLQHLELACQDLRTGRYSKTAGDLGALGHAQAANEASEKAFFEPSMVGQVYFPDEHKVAVYVPLLGPMGVPLVLAGVKELLGWYRGRGKVKGA
ncbi:hypothetical protein B0A55_04543 [Friedmanniomyces simplex]|uniref:GPI transamidase component PIG-S n=1 Tax=Friedmanniomyces simplex TaxID=329884 RepID=A0A4U0XQ72_9PEZI|nr:hypothetical protein B0A55_04543 [Friedmanniomyces simplex]